MGKSNRNNKNNNKNSRKNRRNQPFDISAIRRESDLLNSQLERCNSKLEVKTIEEDGNCMFATVADQLWGDSSRHQDVRWACCDYLEETHQGEDDGDADPSKMNWDLFIDEDEGPFLTNYLGAMRTAGTWGTQLELLAISRKFNVNLAIFEVNGKVIEMICEGEGGNGVGDGAGDDGDDGENLKAKDGGSEKKKSEDSSKKKKKKAAKGEKCSEESEKVDVGEKKEVSGPAGRKCLMLAYLNGEHYNSIRVAGDDDHKHLNDGKDGDVDVDGRGTAASNDNADTSNATTESKPSNSNSTTSTTPNLLSLAQVREKLELFREKFASGNDQLISMGNDDESTPEFRKKKYEKDLDGNSIWNQFLDEMGECVPEDGMEIAGETKSWDGIRREKRDLLKKVFEESVMMCGGGGEKDGDGKDGGEKDGGEKDGSEKVKNQKSKAREKQKNKRSGKGKEDESGKEKAKEAGEGGMDFSKLDEALRGLGKLSDGVIRERLDAAIERVFGELC